MGTTYSPSVVTNGLVMYYDMSNTQKSWRGAPVTNLLPNPTINSVPTTGNSWGTYNTNQYNGATYFSIGSISSVSSNIVTTSGNHPLRSYDVVTPQSTGGGVTAGTNYLVKKLSATTFSLHTWNSSQDGSQGYINPATGTHKVYDDFANDVRISINSSSFPTMWWGPPHLPNSGLVKEVRTNGCSIPGIPTTDCLRLYHTRPDNVTDGMAYSVDANVTAGVAHTVSFWTKTVNAAAVGQYISYQIYNYGATTPTGYSFNAVFGPVGVWVKQSMTFTPNNPYAISYWFPSSGNIIYDLAHIQFETGSVANAWTDSSRSTTQSLLDLSGRNAFTVNSLTYSSDNNNSFSFNGSNNASTNSIINVSDFTVEVWFKSSSVTNYRNPIDCNWLRYPGSYSNVGPRLEQNNSGNLVWVFGDMSGNYEFRTVVSSGLASSVYHSASLTKIGNTFTSFYNGSVVQSAAASYAWPGDFNNVNIGRGFSTSGERWFIGEVPVVKLYNRGLSATEIQQNFDALRRRYGI
jgi:hypothetical protein